MQLSDEIAGGEVVDEDDAVAAARHDVRAVVGDLQRADAAHVLLAQEAQALARRQREDHRVALLDQVRRLHGERQLVPAAHVPRLGHGDALSGHQAARTLAVSTGHEVPAPRVDAHAQGALAPHKHALRARAAAPGADVPHHHRAVLAGRGHDFQLLLVRLLVHAIGEQLPGQGGARQVAMRRRRRSRRRVPRRWHHHGANAEAPQSADVRRNLPQRLQLQVAGQLRLLGLPVQAGRAQAHRAQRSRGEAREQQLSGGVPRQHGDGSEVLPTASREQHTGQHEARLLGVAQHAPHAQVSGATAGRQHVQSVVHRHRRDGRVVGGHGPAMAHAPQLGGGVEQLRLGGRLAPRRASRGRLWRRRRQRRIAVRLCHSAIGALVARRAHQRPPLLGALGHPDTARQRRAAALHGACGVLAPQSYGRQPAAETGYSAEQQRDKLGIEVCIEDWCVLLAVALRCQSGAEIAGFRVDAPQDSGWRACEQGT
eukprot:scaffold1396_cov252-Pinguiococcus_pyrenoidosus.AAC.11